MRSSEISDTSEVKSDVGNVDDTSTMIHGKCLEPPILGNFYRIPDFPRTYSEPTILDASLSHIPVYAHLKTYDLKLVPRPETPPLLSGLRVQLFRDNASHKSSKLAVSTARSSKGRNSATLKSQEGEKVMKRE